MSTDMDFSNATQTISEQLRANLEATATKAFPGTTQAELRVKFLDVLLVIANGHSATDSQLDDFLIHDANRRICAITDCGQIFKRRDKSRVHIRAHLDDRPYVCYGQCGEPVW